MSKHVHETANELNAYLTSLHFKKLILFTTYNSRPNNSVVCSSLNSVILHWYSSNVKYYDFSL